MRSSCVDVNVAGWLADGRAHRRDGGRQGLAKLKLMSNATTMRKCKKIFKIGNHLQVATGVNLIFFGMGMDDF